MELGEMFKPESQGCLMQAVDDHKASCGILTSRYLVTLQNGEMPLHVFESSQRQFFFAVRFFSRAMAVLAARVPDSTTRLALIQNLAEEHGLAETDELPPDTAGRSAVNTHFQPQLAHEQTFLTFLERLRQGRAATSNAHQEQPAVRAFNLALWGSCALDHPATAFACLGAIEYAFADVSASIGSSVVNRRWMNHDELVHYKLHAEVDKRHAADFFQVVAGDWNGGDADRQRVQSGLAMGFYLFKRLYDDLLAEATHE